MKHIFSFVLSALIAVFFTTAHAQQNIYVWKNGNFTVRYADEVDSLTFSRIRALCNVKTSLGQFTDNTTLPVKVSVEWRSRYNLSISANTKVEVGICYSSTNTVPTYEDKRISTFYDGIVPPYSNITLSDLATDSKYYIRSYVKFGNEVYYSSGRSVNTPKATDVFINGHKFVDLGLPSGLLWAECNVGASSESEAGDYFAWGETETKETYSWDTYKWNDGTTDNISMSKYNSTDEKGTLDSEDDAATVNWGLPCRMPSSSEFEELIKECDWSWWGNGYRVTSTNGNSVFFPASGYRSDDVYYYGTLGFYWSRSIIHTPFNSPFSGFYLRLGDFEKSSNNTQSRCYGFSIRPVATK